MNKLCATGFLSLSQRERMEVRDCLECAVQDDSSPSPSPRARRRGIRNLISRRISNHAPVSFLLSLSQRERMKVRDCCDGDFQAFPKSTQERYQVLPGLDDSRSGSRQFLVFPKIRLVPDRVSRAGGSCDLNHPIRWQASRPDNRNPGCKDRWDAVAGIYELRTSDFEDGAREYVRNRSRSCGGNEHASLTDSLIMVVSCEKEKYRPLTLILSPQAGRGGQEQVVGGISVQE
jgi:hypothetical protein